jgi:hypothetical protein
MGGIGYIKVLVKEFELLGERKSILEKLNVNERISCSVLILSKTGPQIRVPNKSRLLIW